MSVKKQDLYELIDLIDDKYTQPAYELLRKFINSKISVIDELIMECDDSPLTEKEKKTIEDAEESVKKGEYITLKDLEDELKL
jgi:hypothetical protein